MFSKRARASRFKRARAKTVAPYTGKSAKVMLARREATYDAGRLQALKRDRAELLSGYLRHGAKWERSEPCQPSLAAMVESCESEAASLMWTPSSAE